jgi:DNA-nicking Smr family endonuclease
MEQPKTKSLNFTLPSEQEALTTLGRIIQGSGLSAEAQIALRLWLSDYLPGAPDAQQVEEAGQDDGGSGPQPSLCEEGGDSAVGGAGLQ